MATRRGVLMTAGCRAEDRSEHHLTGRNLHRIGQSRARRLARCGAAVACCCCPPQHHNSATTASWPCSSPPRANICRNTAKTKTQFSNTISTPPPYHKRPPALGISQSIHLQHGCHSVSHSIFRRRSGSCTRTGLALGVIFRCLLQEVQVGSFPRLLFPYPGVPAA